MNSHRLIIAGCVDSRRPAGGRRPAGPSIDSDRWRAEFEALLDRISPRFNRYATRRRAGSFLVGLIAGLGRVNF